MLAVWQCAGWDGLKMPSIFIIMKIVENYDDHDENDIVILLKTMMRILILMKIIL